MDFVCIGDFYIYYKIGCNRVVKFLLDMFFELNIFEKINEEINVMMEYKYSFFI